MVRPPKANAGDVAEYARRLKRLNAAMFKSVEWYIPNIYKRQEGLIVGDASPALQVRDELDKLFRKYRKVYDGHAKSLAEWYTNRLNKSTTSSLYAALRQYVPTVNPKLTPGVRNILATSTVSNVGLIQSIPEEYFGKIQGSVMRAMQAGRDLTALRADIDAIGHSTDKRAEFIARDQANKATSAINIARQKELGITRAVWLHVRGGLKPRKSHVEANDTEFELAKGCYIEGEYIQPGEKPNCGCIAAPVIDAFK